MSAKDAAYRRRRAAKAAGVKLPPRPKDPAGAPKIETWRDRANAAFAAGDEVEALRIASRHIRTGDAAEPIARAYEAAQRPAFARQLGRDPEALVRAGVEALKRLLA